MPGWLRAMQGWLYAVKVGGVLAILAVATGAVGYLELKHQAERAGWRAELAVMQSRLDRAERSGVERAEAEDATAATGEDQNLRKKQREATEELADLEMRILDAAAELATLESDRTVAEARAEAAIEDLKAQVRAFTAIEMDMAALDRRRQRLGQQVETVEERLHQAEMGAAERQKRAEALDRDIAELAIRRETLRAGLETIEREAAASALAAVEATAAPETAPAPVPVAARSTIDEISPDLGPENDTRDRTRGLYQFGSLSASPASDAGLAVPPSEDLTGEDLTGEDLIGEDRADDVGQEAEDEAWAEDQYLLGLTLLSTAERNSGTRELNDAVLAFKAVLGEWPKQRDHMRWAIARSDLGYALALLGRREGDARTLEEATAAVRDALSTLKRDETPLLWAAAQHHLGVSLGGLADLWGDQDIRQNAIEALERSIVVFEEAGADSDAQKAEARLRETSAKLEAALENADE